jgi:hypothetical protein
LKSYECRERTALTFELRTYIAVEGKMEELLTRFREHTVGLFVEHGMRSVGYWRPVGEGNTLIYLLQHEGDPAANWESFRVDPRWIEVRRASETNGELTAGIVSVLLEPTDFSLLS